MSNPNRLSDRVLEIVWPVLEPWSQDELAKMECEQVADLAALSSGQWHNNLDLVIEEARRLSAVEDGRVQTVEGKANNIVLFVGAATPFQTYLGSTPWLAEAKGCGEKPQKRCLS